MPPADLPSSRLRFWEVLRVLGTHILRSAESDTGDARDVLQSQLANGLSGLLLVARVNGNRGTAGDCGLFSVRVGAAASVLNSGLGDLVVGQFLNSWVGHLGCDMR